MSEGDEVVLRVCVESGGHIASWTDVMPRLVLGEERAREAFGRRKIRVIVAEAAQNGQVVVFSLCAGGQRVADEGGATRVMFLSSCVFEFFIVGGRESETPLV